MVDAGTVTASTGSSANMTTVVAVSLAVLNLAVLTILGVVCVRRARRRRHKTPGRPNAAASNHKQGQTNGGFRTEAGTLRSFNSLSSKFSPTDDADADTISTSSISTIS